MQGDFFFGLKADLSIGNMVDQVSGFVTEF
jgi:hypothetical protein